MPDDPNNAPTNDTAALDQVDNLAAAVQDSFSQNGPSDQTISLLKDFVTAYVQASGASLQPSSGYDPDLVSAIVDYLGLGQSDPTVGNVILAQIENIAAGKQVASSTPSQKNVQKAADPIEMFSGQFQQEAVDVTINGAGMDFIFRRFYANQAVYFGPLGASWDHSYNLHICQLASTLLRSTGELRDEVYTRHPLFGQTGFNYWVPPDGQMGIIEEAGTSFIWRSPSGVRCYYQQDSSDPLFHIIRRIEDRFSNYLAFTYQSGLLYRVEINHPARFVVFDYDTLGRIISLQDHANRQWIYTYDDYGDLVSVTSPATERYPAGLMTCYEYSSSDYSPPLQHNLLRVIDPAGNLYLENDYAEDPVLLSFNRVIRQRQGNGEFFFEYETVVDDFEYDYDDSEKPAIQVNQMLRNGQVVHLIYNKFGNLLLREEYVLWDGLENLLQWRYRYNRDGSLVGMITPEGCVTQYYYGRDDYLGVYDVTDNEVATDSNLTSALRMGFGNVLAIVRRSKRYDFSQMDLSLGVWGDFFPDVLAALDSDDIVVKNTYDSDYQQLLTTSDPRFTVRADPRYAEAASYGQHLTRFEYAGMPLKTLSRIVYPDTTFPSPLPDGTSGLANTSDQYLQYDSQGRLQLAQDPEGNISRTDYFQGGPADPTTGYVRSVVQDLNHLQLTTTFAVNKVGINKSVRNPRGIRTTFDVNDLDQTTATISGGPGFKALSFFDENGLLERIERDNLDDVGHPLPDGNEIRTFKYDEQSNLLQETHGGADLTKHHVVRYRYDSADCRVATILPLGNRTTFTYEERMLLASTVRGAGSSLASRTKVLFDGDSRKVADIDGRGNYTRCAYDAFGRITSTTDAMGNMQQSVYDKLGNVILSRFYERRANGSYYLLRRSSVDYDERGNNVRKTDFLFSGPILTADVDHAPDLEFNSAVNQGAVTALVTQFFYDRDQRLFRTISPSGQVMNRKYDGASRKIWEQDNIGNYVQTFYDENSNVTRVDRHELVFDPTTGSVVDEDVFSTINEYDPLDRLIAVTDGLGNRTTITYDSRDNPASVTDPLGNVKRYQYDVFNRKTVDIVEMTRTGLGGGVRLPDVTTQYLYDDNDRVTSIIDAKGIVTQFSYDELNRRFATIYADASEMRLAYDPDDNVVDERDNNGLHVLYTIDPLNRRTRLDLDTTSVNPAFPYPAGAEQFEQYSYDGLGRPLQSGNDFCQITVQFDSLGRAYSESIQLTTPLTGPTGALGINRKFDLESNPTDIAYPSGRLIHFDFDGLNRVKLITNQAHGAGYPGSSNLPIQYQIGGYTYRGLRLDSAKFGNQTTSTFAYDGEGRLIDIVHASAGNAFLEIQQLFDGAGNRRFHLDNPAVPGRPDGEAYSFDSMYRLTRFVRKPLLPITPGQFEPPSAPLAANALVGQQTIDTAIGSLAQNPASYVYRYDAMGNRERVRRPGLPPTTYSPNQLNQYTDVGGVTLRYDQNGNLIDDGSLLYFYNYRNQLVQAVKKSTNVEVLRMLYDAVGRLLCVNEGGQATFLISDGLGVIEEYAAGVLSAQYVYADGVDARCQLANGGEEWWYHADSLSSSRLLTDSSGQPLATRYDYEPFGTILSAPAHYNPYLFSGKRYLASIDGYDSRARQYSSALGRFLQRDPKGIADDLNAYVYGGNNPVTFVDRLGTEKQRTQPSKASSEINEIRNKLTDKVDTQATLEFLEQSKEGPEHFLAHNSLNEDHPIVAPAPIDPTPYYSEQDRKIDEPIQLIPYIGLGTTAGQLLGSAATGTTVTGQSVNRGQKLLEAGLSLSEDWATIEMMGAGAKLLGAGARIAPRLAEGVFENIGRPLPVLGRGGKLAATRRLRRFFIQDTANYPGVSASWGGRLLKRLPGLRQVNWQQGHIFFQQNWSRVGSAGQLFPGNTIANLGVRRVANAGWNLMPLPGSLNNWLGQRSFATAVFGTAVYGGLGAETYLTAKQFAPLFDDNP